MVIQVGVWDWHLESGAIYIDPLLKHLIGYEEQEIPNQIDQWAKHVHPEDLPKVIDAANACIAGTCSSFEIEHRMVHKNGSTVWFLARGQVIWDQVQQKPLRLMGTDTDVTSFKLAEEQIMFQANILAHVSDAIMVTDNHHTITYWNPAATDMYGYTAKEAVGQRISDIIGYDWRSSHHHLNAFSDLIANGAWQGEVIHSCKDGNRIFVESSASVIKDQHGDRVGFLAVSRDISDRKQAEQELKQAKEQLQAVIDAVPGFVSWIDQNGRYIGVNRKLADILELPPEEIVGKEVGFSGSSGKFKQFVAQFIANDAATTSQIIDTNFNNRQYHYLVAAQKYNQNQAIVSVGIDITATQKSQEALRSLVAGTAAVTGTEFFAVLVQYLAQALEVKCAVVAELENGCRTVALWLDGQLGENFTYASAGTPCDVVIKKGVYYCRSQVIQKFPALAQFSDHEPMESYFGIRLENSAGEPIGVLCVLDDRPLENEKIARYILSIFAARAAVELERQHVELELKQAKLDLETRVNNRTQALSAANDEFASGNCPKRTG